jgi:hypothetical protein
MFPVAPVLHDERKRERRCGIDACKMERTSREEGLPEGKVASLRCEMVGSVAETAPWQMKWAWVAVFRTERTLGQVGDSSSVTLERGLGRKGFMAVISADAKGREFSFGV